MADDSDTPDAPDVPDIARLVERVDEVLLGSARKFTRVEMAEQSGLDLDEVRALWRALGFASMDDDDGRRAFTDADLAALRDVRRLAAVGGIDDEVMRAMTRIIGQSFARLASWQGQLILEIVGERPELLADGGDRVVELVDELVPLTGRLHDYVWRRQLASYFDRRAGSAGDTSDARAVGFADMAAFTAFTRRSSESELRGVLERFETLATDIVGANRGQIVKTIGDEVLFVADRSADCAEIALSLIEAAEQDDTLPELRVGLAAGPVVSRLGDVFGQTVNIASRLTSLARAGSVLVDEGMAQKIEGDERFALRPLRPASVRGYHHLKSWRLRRGTPG